MKTPDSYQRGIDALLLKAIRSNAAELVRAIRADYPGLKGVWTRRQWNHQARRAGRNFVENMTRFWRVNQET